jgi:hypothetical protein
MRQSSGGHDEVLADPRGGAHDGRQGEVRVHDALAPRGVDGDDDVADLADHRVLQVQVEVPPELVRPEPGLQAVLATDTVLRERHTERRGRDRERGEVHPNGCLPLLGGVGAGVIGHGRGRPTALIDSHEDGGSDRGADGDDGGSPGHTERTRQERHGIEIS